MPESGPAQHAVQRDFAAKTVCLPAILGRQLHVNLCHDTWSRSEGPHASCAGTGQRNGLPGCHRGRRGAGATCALVAGPAAAAGRHAAHPRAAAGGCGHDADLGAGLPGRAEPVAAAACRRQRHGTSLQLAPAVAHARLPRAHGRGGARVQGAAGGAARQDSHQDVPLCAAHGGAGVHNPGRHRRVCEPHRQAARAHPQPVQRPLLAGPGGALAAGAAVRCGRLLLPLAQAVPGQPPGAGSAAPLPGQGRVHRRHCHHGGGHPGEGHLCAGLWQAARPACRHHGAARCPGGPAAGPGAGGALPPCPGSSRAGARQCGAGAADCRQQRQRRRASSRGRARCARL